MKNKWEEEFEEEIVIDISQEEIIYLLNLSSKYRKLGDLINKYIGDEVKVKIKVRKGVILIERID